MKKLFVALFLLTLSFHPNFLFSSNNIVYRIQKSDFFETLWTKSEDESKFIIRLKDGLEFTGNYSYSSIENGKGIRMSCKPAIGQNFSNDDGYWLDGIKIKLDLRNTIDLRQIDCMINSTHTFLKYYLLIDTQKTTSFLQLLNPQIDLTQEPVFVILNENLTEAVISFKNVSPNSL